MSSVLVTGANRGIGLEVCRIYHNRGDNVFAVCRERSVELDTLGVRIIDGVDVSIESGINSLSDSLKEEHLDIVLNNAGILRRDTFDTLNYEEMEEQFRVNTLGPLRVSHALSGNLGKGSKIGIVTSRVGSIEDNGSGNNYGYRCSKSAVNMVGMNLHHDLSPRGIAIALLHPGLVATDMTGGTGIAPADSAAGIVTRMDELTLETSGSFWHAEGYVLPW